MNATASARKSKGSYKPLIKLPNGRTQVVEQAPDRLQLTVDGIRRGPGFYARGATYQTREEAVAAAQASIDARREDAEERLAKSRAAGRQDHPSLLGEVELWGGSVTAD